MEKPIAYFLNMKQENENRTLTRLTHLETLRNPHAL
jgi:hypothetical protein